MLDWNGRDGTGAPFPDGAYELAATYLDAQGSVTAVLPLTLDSMPPVLTVLDPKSLRFRLSEPATVTLLVNGATVVKVEPAGTFNVPLPAAGIATVSAQARDAAGNVSATVGG